MSPGFELMTLGIGSEHSYILPSEAARAIGADLMLLWGIMRFSYICTVKVDIHMMSSEFHFISNDFLTNFVHCHICVCSMYSIYMCIQLYNALMTLR